MPYLTEEALRKLDAPLRRLLTTEAAELAAYAKSRLSGVRVVRGPLYTAIGPIWPERIKFSKIKRTVIVRFHGNREDLIGLGLRVRSQAQDVFTVTGDLAALAELAQQPATRAMEVPRTLEPTVEDAAGQAEVYQVHQPRSTNPNGYQGNNVLIGIIDWPLDVTHNTFRNAGGSRVLYLWAPRPSTVAGGNVVWHANPPGQSPDAYWQANPTTTPNFSGLTNGRVYDKADIDAALGNTPVYGTGANQICCEPFLASHGTHVAGIAAGDGDGNAGATAHVGAAPQADMVFVGCQTWDSAQILDAVRFILAVADHLNRPVVINLSMGSNWDGHTGESSTCQFIDNQLNSFNERVVVIAAGNDNNDRGMRTGVITSGNTETFTMTATSGATPGDIAASVWTRDVELDVRLSVGGAQTPWQLAGNEWNGTLSGFNVWIDRMTEGTVWCGLNLNQAAAMTAGPVTIELRNPSGTDVTYVAWACSQGQLADFSGAVTFPNRHTLADVATARGALTVGSCDKVIPVNPAQGETISGFSGAGPTLDGRVKPEIVAIGNPAIQSANSNQASGWTGKGGTSMAAPLVAGAVACLLQEARGNAQLLNHDGVRGLLTRHTNSVGIHVDPADPLFAEIDRNRYGYGRLRMIGPIDQIAPPASVDLWIRTADDDFGAQPFIGDAFWTSPDIRVFDPGTGSEILTIPWNSEVDVRVRVRNLGDDPAIDATVRLYYALPWTAPNDWFPAEDAANAAQVTVVDVPAIDDVEISFKWRPEPAEIPTAMPTDHYCLLVTVDHPADLLQFIGSSSTSAVDAWALNVRGSNNVALRNVHIN